MRGCVTAAGREALAAVRCPPLVTPDGDPEAGALLAGIGSRNRSAKKRRVGERWGRRGRPRGHGVRQGSGRGRGRGRGERSARAGAGWTRPALSLVTRRTACATLQPHVRGPCNSSAPLLHALLSIAALQTSPLCKHHLSAQHRLSATPPLFKTPIHRGRQVRAGAAPWLGAGAAALDDALPDSWDEGRCFLEDLPSGSMCGRGVQVEAMEVRGGARNTRCEGAWAKTRQRFDQSRRQRGVSRHSWVKSKSGAPTSLSSQLANRVPVLQAPSLEDFWTGCMARLGDARPAVIRGAMAHWPALERWRSPRYVVGVAGFRTVPVELGSTYLAEEVRPCDPMSDPFTNTLGTQLGSH